MSLEQFELTESRSNLQLLADTSPSGVGSLAHSLFEHGLYPQGTSNLVRALDQEFLDDFWTKIEPRYGREATGKPSSTLGLLYFYSRDFVGPVRSLFALSLSQEFQEAGDNLHFLARDGLPEYIAFKTMAEEAVIQAPTPYNYVPLSVRLMRETNNHNQRDLVKKYLDSCGFANPGQHVIVDIGFTGEIPDLLSRLYPENTITVRFLISKVDDEVKKKRPVTESAKGFWFDPECANDAMIGYLLQQVSIVRALEDTWSGIQTSTTNVSSASNGDLLSNSTEYPDSYDKARRIIALRGIKDSALIISEAIRSGFSIHDLLKVKNTYFSNLKQLLIYYHDDKTLETLFVPHEPTNP